ncbi:Na/Pi cotransporter family protein [Candidatus Uabimicrobium sp. HlEnr_7]|uniref:Na/Pi cotransporter family protein n=1 Tax=Candidatus Uabimicrobium helgolandensis TaxID=3095367 RepID=UPI00355691FF
MNTDWMQIVGGFGLFLLSLRLLNRILETSIANSIKPLLKKVLSNRFFSIVIGCTSTIFVQASSITIIASMGLLGTSLITLEQSFLVMLGATVGTTIKSWFFAVAIHEYGLAIVGFSSITLIIVRRPVARELIEALLAIGLAFLALHFLYQGLEPIVKQQWIQALLKEYAQNSSISSLLTVVGIGCFTTMLVQSSSTIIFLVLELSRQGFINYPMGAAIILGANIGTTITPFIASLEYSRNVKRLAVSHIVIKIIGVCFTLSFFSSFLLFVDAVVPGNVENAPLLHLAAVHTIFNVINVIFWGCFSTLVVKFLFYLIPSESYDKESQSLLPTRVRRMLARHPQHAFREVDKQISRLKDMTKRLADYSLELLTDGVNGQRMTNSMLLQRRFESFKEVIYDLLVRLKQNPLNKEDTKHIQTQLNILADISNFYILNLSFKDHVEKGLILNGYQVPSEIRNLFQEYQKGFNEIWLKLFLGNIATNFGTNLNETLQDLENLYAFYLTKKENTNSHELYWLYETIRYQNHAVLLFFKLYETATKLHSR